MTSVGLCPTSDVITFGQNWHCLYSNSAGGRDLSNGTHFREIGSIEREICTKMLRNLSEKLSGKFHSGTLGQSMVRISRADDAFSGILELEASPVEGQPLQQKDKKRRKRKSEKKNSKTQKPKDVGHLLLQKLKILISAHARANVSKKRDASGKKGTFSSYKCRLH